MGRALRCGPGEGYGSVVQLVRTLACHARGRGFEPHPNRQKREKAVSRAAERRTTAGAGYASVAQLVEQRTENPRVVGSIPTGGTKKEGSGAPVGGKRAARGRNEKKMRI